MKPYNATLIANTIEAMIVCSIAAAMAGKIQSKEYEDKIQDQRNRLAEALEDN